MSRILNQMKCQSCGASELIVEDNYYYCTYCDSTYIPDKDKLPDKTSTINLISDIDRLINLIKTDPENKIRYINLILDIDPYNEEVKLYI